MMQSSVPAAARAPFSSGHLRPTPSTLQILCRRLARCLRGNRRDASYEDLPDGYHPRYRPQRINALIRQTNFTKAEIKLIYQGFKQVCPTGIVNEDTFKDVFATYFPQGDANLYAHYVFKACDQQNNGTIDFQEFLGGLSTLTRGPPEEKLRWTFRLYDVDGDGRIGPDEMRDVIASVYRLLGAHTDPCVCRDTPARHADRVFRKLDRNNDGYVTFDEFLECCQKDENVIGSLPLLDTVL